MISDIHTKGHHSADRNLRYASEYIYWPEKRKDFRTLLGNASYARATKNATPYPPVMPKPSLSPPRDFQPMLFILWVSLPN